MSPKSDLDDLDDESWDFELVTFICDFELKVYVEMVKIFENVKLERMYVALEKDKFWKGKLKFILLRSLSPPKRYVECLISSIPKCDLIWK